jgi:serine/threonine-protein kinase RsbW
MPTMSTTIAIKNRLSELERVGHAVEKFGQHLGLPANVIFELTLAVDEVVTNIISYAYDDPGEHDIVVRLKEQSGDIIVEIEDDGRPFNPLTVPEPRVDLPLQERPIGGLGMHLVRKVTDAVEYHRRQDKNLLVMRKKVSVATGASARGEHETEISETKMSGIIVLAVAGRLDAGNAPALDRKLHAAIDAGTIKLVVDAGRIDFIGSAGLQVLLVAAKRLAAAGGKIGVAAANDDVKAVFEIAGLSSQFEFYRTVSEAVAALASTSTGT